MTEMLPREWVLVDDLKPHPRNPRKITPARLAALERVLAADPEMLQARPLIALPDGTVVAGNQRHRAATSLRDKGDERFARVPTVTVDLDDDRAIEWALRDNEGFGERDDSLTAQLLAELAGRGRNLELTGLTEHDLRKILGRDAGTADPDLTPPRPSDPASRRGELYQLGAHWLVCGDATSRDDLGLLLDGDPVDAVWTDPPYGVDYHGGTGMTLQNDDLAEAPLHTLVRAALAAAFEAATPGAPIYVCHPDSGGLMFRQAFAEAGWTLKQVLVWVKQQFVLSRQDYNWQHEPILYGWKPGGPHPWYGMGDQSTVADDDDLRQMTKHELIRLVRDLQNDWRTTVLREDRPHVSELHPTTKPVALITRCLINSTRAAATVYDPFGGSGSTLIAAETTGRQARLMEIDPAYCDVIRARYAAFTGQPEWAP